VQTRNRYILLIVLFAWAVAMLALSPWFIALHHETKAVEQTVAVYTNSLVNQHFDDAYKQCGSDFRAAMPYPQFLNFYQSLQTEYGPLKAARRSGYEVHGSGSPMFWRGVIDADLSYEKKTLRFEFVFHKEGDRWVLFGAEQL